MADEEMVPRAAVDAILKEVGELLTLAATKTKGAADDLALMLHVTQSLARSILTMSVAIRGLTSTLFARGIGRDELVDATLRHLEIVPVEHREAVAENIRSQWGVRGH